MTDAFIGDPLTPDGVSFDADRMAAGEPGVPRAFLWRGETVEVREVVRSWKDTAPCTHGSGERYVNKHWYELRTNLGTMTVYFERRPRRGTKGARWWLYTLREETAAVSVPVTCPTERRRS